MPPKDSTVTLPRDYARQSLVAAKELGEALGANAEVVERAEATILQAQADRQEIIQALADARVAVERAVAKLDARETPPPVAPPAASAVLGHWLTTKHGAVALSALVTATAAVLFGISLLLGFDPRLVLPGGSP